MSSANNLNGTITKVTDTGRGAIVMLDTTHDGRRNAVINNDTNGRIGLMSANPSGKMKEGQRVTIHGTKRGLGSLVALRVS